MKNLTRPNAAEYAGNTGEIQENEHGEAGVDLRDETAAGG
jgi:hypothetical protein